jgi:hypothetical protein
MADKHVFGDGQIAKQAGVLVHDSETVVMGLQRRMQIQSASFEKHMPVIRAINACEQFHTGALACSVLSDERQDLARP